MLIFRLFIILYDEIFQISFLFIKCYVYVYNVISSYYDISVQWLCCIVYDILVLDSLQTIALLCFSNYTIAKKKRYEVLLVCILLLPFALVQSIKTKTEIVLDINCLYNAKYILELFIDFSQTKKKNK